MSVEKYDLPTTPRDFKYRDVHPTEALKDLWKHVTGTKVGCPECREVFSRIHIFEENYKPLINHEEGLHLLYQIDNWRELFYVECPNCGENVDLKGGINRDVRERNWN